MKVIPAGISWKALPGRRWAYAEGCRNFRPTPVLTPAEIRHDPARVRFFRANQPIRTRRGERQRQVRMIGIAAAAADPGEACEVVRRASADDVAAYPAAWQAA